MFHTFLIISANYWGLDLFLGEGYQKKWVQFKQNLKIGSPLDLRVYWNQNVCCHGVFSWFSVYVSAEKIWNYRWADDTAVLILLVWPSPRYDFGIFLRSLTAADLNQIEHDPSQHAGGGEGICRWVAALTMFHLPCVCVCVCSDTRVPQNHQRNWCWDRDSTFQNRLSQQGLVKALSHYHYTYCHHFPQIPYHKSLPISCYVIFSLKAGAH